MTNACPICNTQLKPGQTSYECPDHDPLVPIPRPGDSFNEWRARFEKTSSAPQTESPPSPYPNKETITND